MSSLHDLQSSFTAALLDAQDAGGLAGEIVTAGIAAAVLADDGVTVFTI